MEGGPLDKLEVQRIISVHLGMYLPSREPDSDTDRKLDAEVKVEITEIETLKSIKEEDEEEETLVDIQAIKAEVNLMSI